jgi:NAD(P)-dependent dehydrogenase (short-subunit alcohol dehydrogenase family)
MTDLTGRVVLLTGASGGIGAAIATILGRAGASVVAHHLDAGDRAGAEAALADVPPDRKLFLPADFAEPKAADPLWRAALDWRGRVDALVLNAAITRMGDGFEDPEEDWEESWDAQWRVNVLAPARLMRGAVRHWTARDRALGDGVLVTMSSWNAQRGSSSPRQIAYAATKAAIKATAQTVARGYARQGVLSYVIAPGIVRAGMSLEFARTLGDEGGITAGLQMGEWVPPDDIGHLVAFLASGKARHLTGATLDVNGATYVR